MLTASSSSTSSLHMSSEQSVTFMHTNALGTGHSRVLWRSTDCASLFSVHRLLLTVLYGAWTLEYLDAVSISLDGPLLVVVVVPERTHHAADAQGTAVAVHGDLCGSVQHIHCDYLNVLYTSVPSARLRIAGLI